MRRSDLQALLWERPGTRLEGRSGPGNGERRASVNPGVLYALLDYFLGEHGTQATQCLETPTASDRALASLLRFQEEPDCVNFLLETNTTLIETWWVWAGLS